MGLFSKILPALEVVGGAALEFVPGMQLAGAMLITQGIASSGLIGGSVGKFLKSGVGQGLMSAVSLGSLAYGLYGSMAASEAASAGANTSTVASQVAASDASAQAAGGAQLAAGDQFPTPSAINVAAGSDVNAGVTAQSAAAGGATPGQVMQAPQLQANGSQISAAQATTNAQASVSPGANAAVNPTAGAAPLGQNGVSADQGLGAPTGFTPSPDLAGSQYNAAHGLDAGATGPAVDTSGSGGGMMSKLFPANSMGPSPGAAGLQAAGSLLGGLGQGIEQKQAMEQQAAAQQWASRTYSGATPPGQNITVPQGYLQRAQALKSMLGQTAGVNPAPTPAPAGSNSPVPIWQMNSTPRGGMT